jgi:hypothetical protein
MERANVAKKLRVSARNGITAEVRAKIKAAEQTRCYKCNSPRSYTNPFAKCDGCKKRFCFDCIWGGQYLKTMSENEPIRDACDACRLKYGYYSI